jgi:predicted ATPase
MVTSVEIKNFRGFKDFAVSGLEPINIVVGDNASGKTAFLEAIYLAVSGNAQQPLTIKQYRGQDVKFQTNVDSVTEAIYADLFNDSKSEEPITIKLGGRGFENRQLVISRSAEIIVPIRPNQPSHPNRHERRAAKKRTVTFQSPVASETLTVPISLTWTDELGHAHATRATLSKSQLQFQGTNERIPNCFFYAAQAPVAASESAAHYSALKKQRSAKKFRDIFLSVFDQITDIDTGDSGGSSILLADVPWAKELLPLPLLSGGTTRAAAIMLAMTHREDGLVMVDEVENGIFYARMRNFSRALIQLSRFYRTQLVLTTHSEEWIERFIDAAGEETKDIAFWRLERTKENMPTIRKFNFADFRSGMAAGEMR